MPKLNGLNVLKRIKAHLSLQHIYVIMQSTNAMEKEINEAMTAGGNGYIAKPYNALEIKGCVNKAIQSIHKTL